MYASAASRKPLALFITAFFMAVLFILVLSLLSCEMKASASSSTPINLNYPKVANDWYQPAEQRILESAKALNNAAKGKAKNIILFVGDGMGVSTVTAARIFAGQELGKSGEEHELSFDKFPYSGLARTYNTDQQTPDSAGTMTAIMTGVKTKAGVISINDKVIKADCASQQGNELLSALALAELAGKSTGIVSTARITHATPAATYAHAAARGWESDGKLPERAKAQGCDDIAKQLIDFESNLKRENSSYFQADAAEVNGLEVVLGGGMAHFIPETLPGGKRRDELNLLEAWQALYPEGALVQTKSELVSVTKETPNKVFGLFSLSHMQYEAERQHHAKGGGTEPSLSQMTSSAIDVLSANQKGFFLMVEAGRIDHAHHAGNAFNALSDTVELSRAVKTALAKTDERETLIIVTADHSHVMTMAGYPQRGNPILGKVKGPKPNKPNESAYVLDENGKPYTTLSYANGRGMALYLDEADADTHYDHALNAGRKNISDIDTRNIGYHQEALVALESETHGGEDVAIYASGPGAYLISGSHEQNDIFHVMNFAGGLSE